MNLLGACLVLKKAEEGVKISEKYLIEAKKIVAQAQAEFIALKAQVKNN